mgnify:CR=1 FL=1
MDKYPECEKQLAIRDKSQVCGEFLAWLRQHGYYIAEEEHRGDPSPGGNDYLIETRKGIEQLLGGFFEIDLAKVEQEQRAMLDAIRR